MSETRIGPAIVSSDLTAIVRYTGCNENFVLVCAKESGMPDTYVGAGRARRSVSLADIKGESPCLFSLRPERHDL
jgi:hypothetical protein